MTGKQGQTALFQAAEAGRADVVRYLLQHGASAERQGRRRPHAERRGAIEGDRRAVAAGRGILEVDQQQSGGSVTDTANSLLWSLDDPPDSMPHSSHDSGYLPEVST